MLHARREITHRRPFLSQRGAIQSRQISLNGSGLIAVYLTVLVIEAWPR
jgi:hypothetical protein